MRVLHIIGNLENGGAEAVLYRIVTYRSSVVHRVVSLGKRGWYSDQLEDAGIEVDHLNVETIHGKLTTLHRLRRIVQTGDIDVIQGWMYRANIVGGIAARMTGRPIVWGVHCSSHDTLSWSSRMWVHASAITARLLPSLIINCSTRSQQIHDRLGYDAVLGEVINNGYDTDVFLPNTAGREQMRAELGVDKATFLLGTVARWHMQKDQPNLIRALAILRDRGMTNWRCVFVGPQMDMDNSALRAAISKYDLATMIILTGSRRDVPNVMQALDLHVLPSAGSEAFPNVVAEAMASETPCAVTDVGDAGYMVGDTGWVVPPRDPDALAMAIETAMRERRDTPGLWRQRCAAARDRVVENFTIEPMTKKYEAAWRRVIRPISGKSPDRKR